jgi:hypothetical protein
VEDVAGYAMCRPGAVRQAVHRGTLDMDDLVSVVEFIAKRNPLFLRKIMEQS